MKRTIEDVKREIEEITKKRKALYRERDGMMRKAGSADAHEAAKKAAKESRAKALQFYIEGGNVAESLRLSGIPKGSGSSILKKAFIEVYPRHFLKYRLEREEKDRAVRAENSKIERMISRDWVAFEFPDELQWLKQNPPPTDNQ